MNLITDRWIPVIRQNGQPDTIAPWQIAEGNNPVVEINAPRPDFQGALYQFLIGLLQTCFAPEDEDQWLEYWQEMPEPEALQASFEKVEFAFELDNPKGVAFLQDLDLPDCETKTIAALLIEAPGENALKKNTDHFVKRGQTKQLCPSCTATALFTLQINAPAGGSGVRVGLRGGGPLTTLVLPKAPSASLWQKLWLNVLNLDDPKELESTEKIDSSILPWLGKNTYFR